MAEKRTPSGKADQFLIPELDDGLAESGIEIETVYFDPSKISEYAKLVAEAEEKEKQKKLMSAPTMLPASSSIPPPPPKNNVSASSVIINNKLLIKNQRPRVNYTLIKVPKAVPPKDAPPILILGNGGKNNAVSSLPGRKVQPLKRKLTEVDSEEQAKKLATPIGFRCTWEGCGFVNKTEGKTIRHIRQSHFEQQSATQPPQVYDNEVICRYLYPLYESA